MRLLTWLTVLGVCSSACQGPAMPMGDGGVVGTTHVVFSPGTGPIDFAAVPFPDDLYVTGGHVQIGRMPSEDDGRPEMIATEREAFLDLDGFGTSAPVFFRIDGDLDPTSLPATPAASLQMDASVFLLDVESASPTALSRVPVEVHWDAASRLLAVRPYNGHALHEGRTYAAVVTSGGAFSMPSFSKGESGVGLTSFCDQPP